MTRSSNTCPVCSAGTNYPIFLKNLAYFILFTLSLTLHLALTLLSGLFIALVSSARPRSSRTGVTTCLFVCFLSDASLSHPLHVFILPASFY